MTLWHSLSGLASRVVPPVADTLKLKGTWCNLLQKSWHYRTTPITTQVDEQIAACPRSYLVDAVSKTWDLVRCEPSPPSTTVLATLKMTPRSSTPCSSRTPLSTSVRLINGEYKTNRGYDGLASIDRNNKTTLLFTAPYNTIKSYAKDSSPRMVKLQDVS